MGQGEFMSDVLSAIPHAVSHHPPSGNTAAASPKGPGTYPYETYAEADAAGRIRALEEFPSVSVGTAGTAYRFRAECPRDADLFLRAISRFIEPSWCTVPITFYPDVEVSFTLSADISPRDLLWVASVIIDGHVLAQTLESDGRYTGERDFFRDIDVHDPSMMPAPKVLAELSKGMAWYVKSLRFLLTDAKEFVASLKAIAS
jgi:hypothetical protein